MTQEYLVCRTARTVFLFMGKMNPPNLEETAWDSPILGINGNSQPRIFANRKDAQAYCDRMNDDLHHPRKNEDGQFVIDCAPYSDYFIIPIEKGTATRTR